MTPLAGAGGAASTRWSRPSAPLTATEQGSEARWWLGWIALRVVLAGLTLVSPEVASDTLYYFRSLDGLGAGGWGAVLPEYPLPVALALWPWGCLVRAGLSPVLAIWLPLLALDLVVSRGLRRRGSLSAERCWTWGLVLLGPVSLLRLDLAAGVLLAGSVLSPAPRRASGLLALGVGVKLFPVLGLPVTMAAARRPLAVLGWSVASGGLLAATCVAIAGVARLLSPLTYQADRGLQVESVLATPFHLARLVTPRAWAVEFAPSRSWEITGPGVGLALAVAPALQVGALALTVVLALRLARAARRGTNGRDPETEDRVRAAAVWVAVAATCCLITTSKVLSPQYLLWVLPLVVAVHLGVSTRSSRWTAGFMVVLVLTQLLYPHVYGSLLAQGASARVGVATLVLRNLLLTVLSVSAVLQAVRAVAGLRAGSTSGQADST